MTNWNVLQLMSTMLCASALLAYAGSGSVASVLSSSVCDGVGEEDCNGVCLISYSSDFLYCIPNSQAYMCTPNGTKNVTIYNSAGNCTWGVERTCPSLIIIDTQFVPNTPVYITTGPYPEV
jgi:hypothetical protein